MKLRKMLTLIFSLGLAAGGATLASSNHVGATKYNYKVATARTTPYTPLYDNNCNVIEARVVFPNSDWRVGKVKLVHDYYYFQVSGKEWLRSDDATANFNPQNLHLMDQDNNTPNANVTESDNQINLDEQAISKSIFNEVNRLRVMNGLNPLVDNPQLDSFAQMRAETVHKNGDVLNHDGNFSDTHPNTYAGENLGEDPSTGNAQTDAVNAVIGWYHELNSNSANGHRLNMLNPLFTQVGTGVVKYKAAYKGYDIIESQTFYMPNPDLSTMTNDQINQLNDFINSYYTSPEKPSHYDKTKNDYVWPKY